MRTNLNKERTSDSRFTYLGDEEVKVFQTQVIRDILLLYLECAFFYILSFQIGCCPWCLPRRLLAAPGYIALGDGGRLHPRIHSSLRRRLLIGPHRGICPPPGPIIASTTL